MTEAAITLTEHVLARAGYPNASLASGSWWKQDSFGIVVSNSHIVVVHYNQESVVNNNERLLVLFNQYKGIFECSQEIGSIVLLPSGLHWRSVLQQMQNSSTSNGELPLNEKMEPL